MNNGLRRGGDAQSPAGSMSWHVPSIVLAIVVVASPVAIGGVHAAVAAGVACLSLFGLWFALITGGGRQRETGLVAFSIPAVGFSLMAVACLIQLIPVPTSVYRLLQPAGYEAWLTNWEVVFGEEPQSGLHLMSMDPRATSEHALKWIALAATTSLAGWVITDRHRRRLWLGLVLVGGLVVTAVGFIQNLADTDLFLGFYEAEVGVRGISTFVSTNHAASYFGLLAVIGAAYSLDHLRRSPPKASLAAGATVLFLLLCAFHDSDGALLATALGLAVVAVAAARRFSKSRNKLRRRIASIAPGLLLLAALAAMLIPTDWMLAEQARGIEDMSTEVRVHMMKGAATAVPDHAVVGTGAGSTERVISPYLDWHELRGRTIPTIENEPVEWMMTLGPVAGLTALALFALMLARTLPHLWRRRSRKGAVTAAAILVTVGTIAMFHFPFQALGITIVATVALEACLDRRRDRLFLWTTPRVAALFLLGLTLAVAGLLTARATVLQPGAETDYQLEEPERVERALHLHPTDGMLMTALSLDARDEDEQQALEMARRAFELRPRPQQQVILARSYAIADDPESAAKWYADLIHEDRDHANHHFGLVRDRLRYDLRDADLRAKVMAETTERNITRLTREIVNEEGRFPAIEMHLAIIDLRGDRVLSHLKLIDLYQDVEQELLAEVYARNLVNQNLEGPDGERPAGLEELLDLLDGLGREQEALNMADRAFKAGYATPELARSILSLVSGNPENVHDDHWRLIESAIDVGCQPPYEGGERRVCWTRRAVVAEADGDIDNAESLLRRVERAYDDPRPLVNLLSRHRRCRELATLKRAWEGENHHGRIESALDDCVDYSDEFED